MEKGTVEDCLRFLVPKAASQKIINASIRGSWAWASIICQPRDCWLMIKLLSCPNSLVNLGMSGMCFFFFCCRVFWGGKIWQNGKISKKRLILPKGEGGMHNYKGKLCLRSWYCQYGVCLKIVSMVMAKGGKHGLWCHPAKWKSWLWLLFKKKHRTYQTESTHKINCPRFKYKSMQVK